MATILKISLNLGDFLARFFSEHPGNLSENTAFYIFFQVGAILDPLLIHDSNVIDNERFSKIVSVYKAR